MDDRTARLLDALDPIGVSLLLELLPGRSTETQLLERLGEPGQPTGNRRLHRLREARLVEHEAGKDHAPGRQWTIVHPAETEDLLAALFALSDAIDARDRARRGRAKRRLGQARAQRLGIRRADGRRTS